MNAANKSRYRGRMGPMQPESEAEILERKARKEAAKNCDAELFSLLSMSLQGNKK